LITLPPKENVLKIASGIVANQIFFDHLGVGMALNSSCMFHIHYGYAHKPSTDLKNLDLQQPFYVL
jgi:hypothetical protein